MKKLLLSLIFSFWAMLTFAQSPQVQRIWEIAQSGNWTNFPNGNFTIGVLDKKALKKELVDFLKDKKVAGKSIDVRRFDILLEVVTCNIIIVGAESGKNAFIDEVIDKASKGGGRALCLTEKEGMLEEGSHINFINGGAQYEVNLAEIQKAGISLNAGGLRNGIVRNVQVKGYDTNNVKINDLISKKTDEKDNQSEAKNEEKNNRRRNRTGGGEGKPAPAPVSEQEVLLGKAATEKALTDKQTQSLKAYVKLLEQMLDANKIDYQKLRKQYETDQAQAEEEIEDLNLTIIELDSLRKKDSLLVHRELALATSQKNLANAHARTNFYIAIIGIILAFFSIGTAYLAYRDRQIIAREKQKSEALLLNILPAETAQELKETGKATPRQYELATVLFTDFKGFTGVAEGMSPEAIVQELDNCFLAFDEIAEKHNLERIKTIGDSYMCAGGVPTANNTNPIEAVKAGLEMQAFMQKLKSQREAEGKPYFECRLGIHSGKVVAGVVGKKKFAYDIWGDTVNIASRMESSGEVNRINISQDTYNLIKESPFQFEHRGKINAKGKGEIDMYFVNG